MSANILYRTIKKGKSLEVSSPSSFIEMFENAFPFPTILRQENIEILNGMRIGSEYHKETLKKIIEAIETFGEIEIYAEY